MKPVVSIIIPTYNRIFTLHRAIDSVLNQKFQNWELLIVDDRSTDNTRELIDDYIKRDKRIVYLMNKYAQGPGGARNYGIDNANGKYLAFLDSDDEWLDHHLSECVCVLENEGINICSGLWYENRKGLSFKYNPREYALNLTLSELAHKQRYNYYLFDLSLFEYSTIRDIYLLLPSTLVISRDVIYAVGKFDEKLGTNEDMDFFFRITMKFNVGIINSFHAIYYQGPDNLFFFENKQNITDSKTIKRLTYHYNFHIQYSKKQKVLITKADQIHWDLMLRTINATISRTYFYLANINRPFNMFLSKYYWLCGKYYAYLSDRYPSPANKHRFYLSYKTRFIKEKLSFSELQSKIINLKTGNFWLYFEDHVHYNLKQNRLLVYNRSDKSAICLNGTSLSTILNLFPSNYVNLKIADLNKKALINFIETLYSNRMGGLVESVSPVPLASETLNKPSIDPIKEYLLKEDSFFDLELTFYVNSICDKSCSLCRKAFMQFLFCTSNNRSGGMLSVASIKNLISNMTFYKKPVVNVTGGNILIYDHLKELNNFLQKEKITVNYYINYLNIVNLDKLSFLISKSTTIYFLIQAPYKISQIRAILGQCGDYNDNEFNYKFIFIVEKKRDIRIFNSLFKNLPDGVAEGLPYFNGKNTNFFRKYVFLNKKEILSRCDFSLYNHGGIINPNYFGKMVILPDGNILPNINEPPIGDIKSNVADILFNFEKLRSSSWFKNRNDVKPCNVCIFNQLCPPVTNYEKIMETNKICNFKL